MSVNDGKVEFDQGPSAYQPRVKFDKNAETSQFALNPGECSLIRACRHYAEGEASWALVPQQIWLICGLASIEHVLESIEALMGLLMRQSRRPFGIQRTGGKTLSYDEMALVALIAAAQYGNQRHVEALARWLVVPKAQPFLARHAKALARHLAEAGLEIPRRLPSVVPLVVTEEFP